jgi:hypothetical protein
VIGNYPSATAPQAAQIVNHCRSPAGAGLGGPGENGQFANIKNTGSGDEST